MRKIMLFVSVAALAIFTYVGFTEARPEKAMGQEKTHTKTIQLSGGAEVPGPGDADGSGEAKLTMNHDKGEVCYDITVKDIQEVTAAHIHVGAEGKSGAPKVTFKKAADGAWKGCAAADKALLNDFMQNPGNYYVNVHNKEFPNGALRGQLGK
jgi:CHRD domain